MKRVLTGVEEFKREISFLVTGLIFFKELVGLVDMFESFI